MNSMDKFAPSWLDMLSQETTAAVTTVRDPGTMGWRYAQGKRIGFVYGNTLYHENGSDIPLLAPTDDRDFRYWYMPVGKREVWLKAAKLLTDRKRPELDIIISVGFAAPLMTFAGTLYGAILSIWGDPGTAKSTAQQVAAAVWGHPKQTRESITSTPRSVQGRLGRTRNLAAYWDDIQDKRHQDALFQTMFAATQGAEGGRLDNHAKFKERLDWQTMLLACSNASFVEYLARMNLLHKELSTTAGMRRVFEIELRKKEGGPGMVNATDAGRVFGALEQNYGMIGVEYARMLAKEHNEIDLMVADTIKAFCAKVEGVGDEAYWWGTCGVLLAGAKLARRLGAELDVDAMEDHLSHAFLHNRTSRNTEGTEGNSYKNTERALTGFLELYIGSGHLLVTDRPLLQRFLKLKVLREPLPGKPVVVQIVRDARMIRFSKREMREYMLKKDIQPKQVFHGLVKFFMAKMDPNMKMLGPGTPFCTKLQETCVDLIIPAGRPHVLLDMFEAQIKPQGAPTSAASPP